MPVPTAESAEQDSAAASRQPASPRNFTEGCWRCGDPGHRRTECLQYSAELARLRGKSAAGRGGGAHELGCAAHPAQAVAVGAAVQAPMGLVRLVLKHDLIVFAYFISMA